MLLLLSFLFLFFFWNNNVSFKNFTSSIANLVMTNSRKNNFFLKLLSDELLNLYPHWSTESTKSTWHDSTGLFWGCWYYTHNDISTKKSIESFLFACCILWFSDQLICCLVFPADLGYIVTAAICFHLPCVLRLRSRSSNSPLLIDLWKQLSF